VAACPESRLLQFRELQQHHALDASFD
jgi:hypothetical protein